MLLTQLRRGRLKKAKLRRVYGWSIIYTLDPVMGISSALPKLTSAQFYKEDSYRQERQCCSRAATARCYQVNQG